MGKWSWFTQGWQFFKQPTVWRLSVGRWISDWGDAVHILAFNWLVIQQTGSAGAAGLCSAVWLVGQLVGGIPGGWLADRYSAWKLLLVSYLLHAAVIGGFTVLCVLTKPDLTALWTVSLVLGLLGAQIDPAQRSLVKRLFPGNQELARVNSLMTGGGALTQVSGPLLAGLLLTVLPVWTAFAANALSFGLAALTLVGVRAEPGRRERAASTVSAAQGSLLQQLRPLRTVLVCTAVFVLGPAPLLVSFLPFYVQQVQGWPIEVLGFLEAARWGGLGVGILLGSVWLTRIVNLQAVALSTLAGLAFPLLGLAVGGPWPWQVFCLACIGGVAGFSYVCLNQLFLQSVEEQWVGRVTGALSTVLGAGLLLAWLGWSWTIDQFGYPLALGVALAAHILVSGAAFAGVARSWLNKYL